MLEGSGEPELLCDSLSDGDGEIELAQAANNNALLSAIITRLIALQILLQARRLGQLA